MIDEIINELESGNTGLINRQRVKELFELCQPGKGDDDCYCIDVEGIYNKYRLDPTALQEHKEEITKMLESLPDQFKLSGGGGWSFLNACVDKEGTQWTGLHETVEQLFLLGIGLGLVDYLMPRDLWKILPGKMPYLVVKL